MWGDVFSDLLAEHGYTCKRRGSYIAAITSDSGVTLEEFDEGKNPADVSRQRRACWPVYVRAGLSDGDRIELYFTSDWTTARRRRLAEARQDRNAIVNADGLSRKIETKFDGTVIETTTWRDGSTLTAETSHGRAETVEKRADGTTVETSSPRKAESPPPSACPRVSAAPAWTFLVSKPTGSMVAVISPS